MKRHLATAVLLITIFVMASVVCAGVNRVLGDIVIGAGAAELVLVWLLVGVVSIAAALFFIAGSIPVGIKMLHRIG